MNEYYTKFEGIIGLYLLSGSLWTIGPDTPFLMLLIAMTNLYIFWHNYIIVLLRRSKHKYISLDFLCAAGIYPKNRASALCHVFVCCGCVGWNCIQTRCVTREGIN